MNILELLKSRLNSIYAKYLKDDEIDEFPIYYIGGSQVLPPPLTQEEEDDLLRKTFKRRSRGKENFGRKEFKISSIYCKKV